MSDMRQIMESVRIAMAESETISGWMKDGNLKRLPNDARVYEDLYDEIVNNTDKRLAILIGDSLKAFAKEFYGTNLADVELIEISREANGAYPNNKSVTLDEFMSRLMKYRKLAVDQKENLRIRWTTEDEIRKIMSELNGRS